MKIINWNNKLVQFAMLMLLALIWGSSFILMKKGLRSFSYMQVAALRIVIAFVALVPLIIKSLSKLKRANVLSLAIAGYAGIFFPAFLFTKAQTQINSSLAGMINSLAPFFALVLGMLLYKTKPQKKQLYGILFGLIGAFALLLNGTGIEAFQNVNAYALFVVVATLGYGINANEVKHKLAELKGIEVTSLAFLLSMPPALIYLLFSDFSVVLNSETFTIDLVYVSLLAILGSSFSLILFNSLIRYTSALFATSVTYIIPGFAIFWGIIDGETITAMQIFGILLALLGVYLINSRKTK